MAKKIIKGIFRPVTEKNVFSPVALSGRMAITIPVNTKITIGLTSTVHRGYRVLPVRIKIKIKPERIAYKKTREYAQGSQ
jgi:hypothetical protein